MERALFFDFDGVICHSLPECFASSWIAFYGDPSLQIEGWHSYGRDETFPVSLRWDDYQDFCALRPLVRRGEEYLALQEVLHRRSQSVITPEQDSGLPEDWDKGLPSCQEDWDAHLIFLGSDTLAAMEQKFTEVRDLLSQHRKPWWLALNSLYPSLKGLLWAVAAVKDAYILSTKVSRFIAEFLSSQDIEWPLERILYAGGDKQKRDYVGDWLEAHPEGTAFFLDDHPEHLQKVASLDSLRLECRQALWGYGKPLVEHPAGIKEGWRLNDFTDFLRTEVNRRCRG